jgi:hypothetical protein
MLTNGGENAEAIFHSMNRNLFSENFGELNCDQIFTMNIDGSEMKMVSTGLGRTTCSCFLPGDENHLRIYSS